MDAHLKEACRLSGADWAALAQREGGQWLIHTSHHLSKPALRALKDFLDQDSVGNKLAGALNGGALRPLTLPQSAKLKASRLYVFPIPKSSQALLVGGRQLSKNGRDLWRLVSEWAASEPPPVKTILLGGTFISLAT